jgi:hypothetical protein
MMMHTSEIDMANSDEPADIDTFINNAAWAIRKTYHKILKASPSAAQHLNMTQSLMFVAMASLVAFEVFILRGFGTSC